jgi:hypothetical protein
VIFISISCIPIGLWLIRNYFASGTFIGPRTPSSLTLFQNINLYIKSLTALFIPNRIAGHPFILIFLGGSIGILALFAIKHQWQKVKSRFNEIAPLLIFVFFYSAFLILSGSVIAYDPIDYRLLSPLYIPLLIIFLLIFKFLFDFLGIYFSKRAVNLTLIIFLSIWLINPIRSALSSIKETNKSGKGFSGKEWVSCN